MIRRSLFRPVVASLVLMWGCTQPPQPSHPDGPGGMKPPIVEEAQSGAFEILPESASPVSFERMAAVPEPGWNVPVRVSFSPDKKTVVYLAPDPGTAEAKQGVPDKLTMALFSFDLAKKEPKLLLRAADLLASDKPISREEELRRERQRQRAMGITSYQWAAKSEGDMLVPLGGDLFFRTAGGKIERLTETEEPELDPKLCTAGDKVVFVRGQELYSIDISSKKETALTKGAPKGVTRGQSDFNGQEEFDEASGYFPSPACDKVAFLEVDEHEVGVHRVLGYRGREPDFMEQRYPEAGGTNPSVKLGVADAKSKKTTWIKLDGDPGEYLGRFSWAPDGSALFFQSLSRDQKKITIHRVDGKSFAVTTLAEVSSPVWIEFMAMKALDKSKALLLRAPSDGHFHLQTRDPEKGTVLATLTQGDWDVLDVSAVDEEKGLVYFIGTKDSPVERHLYRVPLAGGEPVRLTKERGTHTVWVSPEAGAMVDLHSAIDRAPREDVLDLSGAKIGELPVPADPEVESLKLRPREIITIKAETGETLYGAIMKPRVVAGAEAKGALNTIRKHPVVVEVYGGPHAQTVLDRWQPKLLWQHLADRGFVVFQLDNRGSGNRGPAFEHRIANQLGMVELADQVAGISHIAKLPYVDKERVGIFGLSYGGYMTLLAMLKEPTVFKVGISGAPVTEWRLYDTGYTERYMGTPKSNPKGYEATDLTKMAGGLRGKLLLVHALMDENVHFQHTADMIDALVAAQKPFDTLVFPGERHGFRSPAARTYALRAFAAYFAEHL